MERIDAGNMVIDILKAHDALKYVSEEKIHDALTDDKFHDDVQKNIFFAHTDQQMVLGFPNNMVPYDIFSSVLSDITEEMGYKTIFVQGVNNGEVGHAALLVYFTK